MFPVLNRLSKRINSFRANSIAPVQKVINIQQKLFKDMNTLGYALWRQKHN